MKCSNNLKQIGLVSFTTTSRRSATARCRPRLTAAVPTPRSVCLPDSRRNGQPDLSEFLDSLGKPIANNFAEHSLDQSIMLPYIEQANVLAAAAGELQLPPRTGPTRPITLPRRSKSASRSWRCARRSRVRTSATITVGGQDRTPSASRPGSRTTARPRGPTRTCTATWSGRPPAPGPNLTLPRFDDAVNGTMLTVEQVRTQLLRHAPTAPEQHADGVGEVAGASPNEGWSWARSSQYAAPRSSYIAERLRGPRAKATLPVRAPQRGLVSTTGVAHQLGLHVIQLPRPSPRRAGVAVNAYGPRGRALQHDPHRCL